MPIATVLTSLRKLLIGLCVVVFVDEITIAGCTVHVQM